MEEKCQMKKRFIEHIIDDISSFCQFIEYMGNERDNFEYVVLDIETDSVQEKKAKVYGIGVAFTDDEAIYIPIRKQDGSKWWSKEEEKDIMYYVEVWCSDYKLIGHNIIYDTLVLQNEFPLEKPWWEHIYSDTILLKHALEEEKPFGLKDIAVKYLGDWADAAQEDLKESVLAAGGKWTKEQKDMYLADTNILGKYCCWDVLLTRNLFDIFQPRLEEEGLKELFYAFI